MAPLGPLLIATDIAADPEPLASGPTTNVGWFADNIWA